MNLLITKALNSSGYNYEPTEQNLVDCFLDYVDSGAWSNLQLDEAKEMIKDGELTVEQMCKSLIRIK